MAVSASEAAHHVVGFYRSDDFLAGRVAAFITEGLTAGKQVIVLATASHWAANFGTLGESGLEFRRAVTEGQLLLLDATEVLDGLTVEGRVSVEGFRAALTRSSSRRHDNELRRARLAACRAGRLQTAHRNRGRRPRARPQPRHADPVRVPRSAATTR